jgi:hypothetical protein
MTFYHASNIGNLKEILPLSTLHGSGEKVCYFTPYRAYALFYLRDMEVNHVTCGVDGNGVTVYHEQFPCQLETIYKGRSGYLYLCDESGSIITAHTNGVWASNRKVTVSDAEYISDVYAGILKEEEAGRVRVIRYESLSDDKKREIAEMIKNSIIKHNLLAAGSAKAHFFRENFPQSWQLAERESKRSN